MPSRLALLLGVPVAGALVAGALALYGPTRTAQAEANQPPPRAAPVVVPPSDWCGPGIESLPSDVCYIDGRAGAGRRTLVIWLHGVIGKNTHWSHDHEKMLSRVAKTTSIEMLFPKGVLGPSVYAWPGTAEAQAEQESALIDQWMTAKSVLEKREAKTYDEVFIFGFSSGAYFAGSLAMRGRVDVKGYAVFAGGQPMPPARTETPHIVPVFVGICTGDATTASHGRAFAGSLAAAGIPFAVKEEDVGHDLSPTHFTSALAFLRKPAK